MQIELIPAYLKLEDYLQEANHTRETWEKTMVDPYWNIISQWAPFPEDYKKPLYPLDKNEAQQQLDALKKVDWDKVMDAFHMVCDALPTDDDDIMYVAIYPSNTEMPEGIYGTGVWGNIILNINALNRNFEKWLPFVFAHEYHHNVWGGYWYCLQNGNGLHGWLIESIIIEGEADAFAKSIFGDMKPSWHYGVANEDEENIWKEFNKVAELCLSPEEAGKYIFGCEDLGIPQNAGYYYGIKIVRDYMKKKQMNDMKILMETPLKDIYKAYENRTSVPMNEVYL
jgi:uncharacterized protein YjaZ